MAATGRSRRLAAFAAALLLAAADGARYSVTRTPASVASDYSASEESAGFSTNERSASGEGNSEAGVFSSSSSESDNQSGTSSHSDGPGEVHAASFSDSNSDSGSASDGVSSSASSPTSSTATASSASAEVAKPVRTIWPVSETLAADWAMTAVTAVHARVQSDEPEWDDERQTFVSMFGDNFAEKHRAALDTANTASVEGALMYVQAEGINVKEQSVKCERKNGMAYVVFYAMQIVQTRNSIAVYQSSAPAIEYCPYIAMDSGRCTPIRGDSVFPEECYQYNGLQGETDVGPCVGGESKDTDFRAPYPDTYWFSLPNSCPLEERTDKTDRCRKQYPGGLCDYGSAPDGVNCTFAYRILGYISIDDLVGITRLKNKKTGKYYANYSEFCKAGGVEFSANVDEEAETVDVKKCLDFWDDPTNSTANVQRAKVMVDQYANLVAADTNGRLTALPSVDELTASNPPCYLNNVQCAEAAYGCRRNGYFQVCEVCSSDDEDDSCVVAPGAFSFPDLEVPESSLSASGSEDESASKSESGATSGTKKDIDSESDGESDVSASSGSDADEDNIKATSSDAVSTLKAALSMPMRLAVVLSGAALVFLAI